MTKEMAVALMKETTENAGFCFRDGGCNYYDIKDTENWSEAKVQISVTENHKINMKDTTLEVRFHFNARICSMGGEPTAAELLETAEKIKTGALLMAKLNSMNLGYEIILG